MFKATAAQGGLKLRDLRFYKVALILAVLVGVVGFSFAADIGRVIISNTGRIAPEITARSGYWRDIQDAVNLAASNGIGIVRIPEGTWNFVNIGESWTDSRVVIPAGVSVFGAPTERYENGSVKEWKTILRLPWDVPGSTSYDPPKWFLIQGTGNPNKPSRFSDIKMVGYREIDPNSLQVLRGIKVENVINFRIDHCCFRHVPEGIWVDGIYCCGVIDHNVFDNVYGTHGGTSWDVRTIGYAIRVDRTTTFTQWEPLTNLLGQYTNRTVFIEDNYFTKWRHLAVGNHGAHYVFRRNKVVGGRGFGEFDIHPEWNSPYVGGRCVEVYENEFLNPEPEPGFVVFAGVLHSGSGVFFNNTLSGYQLFIQCYNNGWSASFYPHDLYIWDNNLGGATLIAGPVEEGVHYFRYKPDWYTPFLYPHPFTLR